MGSNVEFRYDSYCGIDCHSCFVLRSYKDKREIQLIDPWSKWLKGMNMQCHGCKSEDVFENCKDCPRRPCAQKKGLEFCFQCREYPCEIYHISKERNNFAHHNVAEEKIKILEKDGLTAWLNYQELRWNCPNCGKTYSWYEKKCWNCGESVLDSVTEEQQLNHNK